MELSQFGKPLSMTPSAIKQRRHREIHPESQLEASRRRYAADPEGQKLRRRAYMAANPHKRKQYHLNDLLGRKSSDTRAFEHYAEQKEKQDGKCAICGLEFGSAFNTHQDHDHETKQQRGLLCSMCNTAIGLLGEDVERMQKAIDYLKGWRQADNE
jgi:hypothetical protein